MRLLNQLVLTYYFFCFAPFDASACRFLRTTCGATVHNSAMSHIFQLCLFIFTYHFNIMSFQMANYHSTESPTVGRYGWKRLAQRNTRCTLLHEEIQTQAIISYDHKQCNLHNISARRVSIALKTYLLKWHGLRRSFSLSIFVALRRAGVCVQRCSVASAALFARFLCMASCAPTYRSARVSGDAVNLFRRRCC